MIPQADPRASYLAHQAEIDAAIAAVLSRGRYILGEQVQAFEEEFAAFVGCSHCVGVASGTDALELALRGCGVTSGDPVFTVSHTAVATVAAIERCGAVPILVDVDPVTFTMDPRRLAEEVERHGRSSRGVVVPVHLYGHPADLPAILEVAKAGGLTVVEDCAQAHGARLGGRAVGSFGAAAAFSFYPTKNLGAIGDGGAVVTDDADVSERVRLLREYGWRNRYVSEVQGFNSRLDELQAAVLRVKLCHLEEGNQRRRAIAAAYSDGLEGTGVFLPGCQAGIEHAYHQYVIRARQREALREYLSGAGVGTLVHYPLAVHQQPAYAGRLLGCERLAWSERIVAEVLSLPMYPELDDEQVAAVVRAIREWAQRG
jgi:dTDP-4-amino-4,6-dideoxygalactose transaminase